MYWLLLCLFSYGDRCPKGVLARVFAVVWFIVGFIIYTFFGAAVAAMMTVTVVNGGPTLEQEEIKVRIAVMDEVSTSKSGCSTMCEAYWLNVIVR